MFLTISMSRTIACRSATSCPIRCWNSLHVKFPIRQTNKSANGGRMRSVRVSAAAPAETYEGAFGRWSVTSEDVAEVYGYRAGITIAAAATTVGALSVLLPDSGSLGELKSTFQAILDPAFLIGGAALGVSLQLIHIYIAVVKRTLQAMWAIGFLGGVYIMATQDMSAAEFVASNPWSVWLVGPMFAALTGVAFKEGFCYRKVEAGGLFGAVPLLLGGHLLQILSPDAERGVLAAVAVLLVVFAGRKYTQPIKDDLGDKSVFDYLKLDEGQRLALVAQQKALQGKD